MMLRSRAGMASGFSVLARNSPAPEQKKRLRPYKEHLCLRSGELMSKAPIYPNRRDTGLYGGTGGRTSL